MTYKDCFVVEVKANGKILRVKDDVTYLPFGSEYSLLLKNLNSRRSSIKINIDGEDVLDGSSLVLQPNSDMELYGFMRGNVARNRFKFIQKTKEIQDYRGDKLDDGLIRVEFAFEKPQPCYQYNYAYYSYPWNFYNSSDFSSKKYTRDYEVTCYNASDVVRSCSFDNDINKLDKPLDNEGITVKGSECQQLFSYTTIGTLEDPQVIIINLKGISETGKEISKPITVKTKLRCPTCGRRSRSVNKFCSNCGTFLM